MRVMIIASELNITSRKDSEFGVALRGFELRDSAWADNISASVAMPQRSSASSLRAQKAEEKNLSSSSAAWNQHPRKRIS
jgi:hypothetical protein